jgi:IS4 transposase
LITHYISYRAVAKEDYFDDFCLKSLAPGQGEYFFIPDILITQQQYGPVNLLVWHNKKYKEPLYLLTNLDYPAEISRYYKKRFIIETFFSDQKTKGFQLHRSRLDDPERIMHLLIAACLAYIFLLLVGIQATNNQLIAQIHRKNRCDWSMFTTGKRALQYLIDQRIWYCLSYNLLL